MTHATRNCPKCSTELTQTTRELITVDTCPNGHGVWLDEGEIQSAVQSRIDDRPESEEATALEAEGAIAVADIAEGDIACLICGKEMAKRNYAYESGVIIDICTDRHGMWLDSGELKRIEAWYEGSKTLAAQEAVEWAGKLDAIERDSRQRMQDDASDIHWGPVNWIMDKLRLGDEW